MSLNYVVTDGAVSSGLSISGYYDSILVSGGTATESLITGGTMTVRGNDSLADKTTVNGSARIVVDFGGRITDTDMTGEGRYSSTGAFSSEIWQSRSANTYFFFAGGREWKARRLKDLYKAFPDQAAALKSFAKEHRYRMENAQQALQIIAHLQNLLHK